MAVGQIRADCLDHDSGSQIRQKWLIVIWNRTSLHGQYHNRMSTMHSELVKAADRECKLYRLILQALYCYQNGLWTA